MDAAPTRTAVVVERRLPQPGLSIRATIATSRLGEEQSASLSKVVASMRHRGILPAGAPFVRYHSFADDQIDLETGIPISEPGPADGLVSPTELPGGDVAVLWHIGAHDRLGEAYGQLEAWLEEHGRERNGPSWEVYCWIDPTVDPDPTTWPEPSVWRTELVQPVR